MSDQKKLDFDRSVSTSLPNSQIVKIDRWADANFSDRSKVLGGILRWVIEQIDQTGGFEQAPGDVIRRLRLNSD